MIQVQGMTGTTRTILLSQFQVPAFDSITCLHDALFLLRNRESHELQLWSGEGGQFVDKMKRSQRPWSRCAISLNGRRYITLEDDLLSTGQISKEGITEASLKTINDRGISCLAISNQGDVALGFVSGDISVYTYQQFQNHDYLRVEKGIHFEDAEPEKIEMNGNLIYTCYRHNVYVVWNWRDLAMIKKFEIDFFSGVLGVQWHMSELSMTRLLHKRGWGGYDKFNLYVLDGESKQVLSLDQYYDLGSDGPRISAYGNFIATWQRPHLSDNACDIRVVQTIKIWSIPSGKLLSTVEDYNIGVLKGVYISPSGDYLLLHSLTHSGSSTIRCWRVYYPGALSGHRTD